MRVASPAEMEALGGALAMALATAGGVVHLHGSLGAGKTTLVRGLLQALGYQGGVKSPTYALLESYELRGIPVHHLDLYRLNDPEELEYIGLRDLLEPGAVCLIEWPERGGNLAPAPHLEVFIDVLGEDSREVRMHACGERGEEVLRMTGNPYQPEP